MYEKRKKIKFQILKLCNHKTKETRGFYAKKEPNSVHHVCVRQKIEWMSSCFLFNYAHFVVCLDCILDTTEQCQSKRAKATQEQAFRVLALSHLPTTFCNIRIDILATFCVSCSFRSPIPMNSFAEYNMCSNVQRSGMHLKLYTRKKYTCTTYDMFVSLFH